MKIENAESDTLYMQTTLKTEKTYGQKDYRAAGEDTALCPQGRAHGSKTAAPDLLCNDRQRHFDYGQGAYICGYYLHSLTSEPNTCFSAQDTRRDGRRSCRTLRL